MFGGACRWTNHIKFGNVVEHQDVLSQLSVRQMQNSFPWGEKTERRWWADTRGRMKGLCIRYDSSADQCECQHPQLPLIWQIPIFGADRPLPLSLSVTFGFLQLLWEFSFLPFCQRLGSKLGLTRKLPFECPQTAKWKYKCWDTWNLGDNTKTGPTHIWFIQGSKLRF